MWTRKLRPPSRVLRGFKSVSGRTPGPSKAYQRTPPPSWRNNRSSTRDTPPPNSSTTPAGAISEALHNASGEDSTNLLAPAHVPEDPNGVLNERHPAAGLLSNSSIVVTRQLELMNVLVGFEQANRYVMMDPQGNHIGYMAEHDRGIGGALARQTFRMHRSFTTHVFDKHQQEVLRIYRPFAWINSRIRVFDPVLPDAMLSPSLATQRSPGSGLAPSHDGHPAVSPLPLSQMRIIGEAQQQWAPLRRKYNLFLHRSSPDVASPPSLEKGQGEYDQFAYVNEPFLSWDFSLLTEDDRLMGSVNRNFAGFGREILTDTGVYALRMDAAGLADEPRHLISQTGRNASAVAHGSDGSVGMTLDQRAIMLATAVSIDFDYFSRRSGNGGFWMMPLWFPGAGEGAAAGAAGGAGAAESGAAVAGGEAGAAAAGAAGRGAAGLGEGAVVGAGTMAGYEAMQRGAYGRVEEPPPTGESSQTPPSRPQPGEMQEGGEEGVWDEDEDPWGDGGGGGGGGGGDDGGYGDWF